MLLCRQGLDFIVHFETDQTEFKKKKKKITGPRFAYILQEVLDKKKKLLILTWFSVLCARGAIVTLLLIIAAFMKKHLA